MTQIFEIASKISTPIALSGFIVAVLFFILRQILKKNIFPKLTKALGADVIRLIITLIFVLSLTAMVLGTTAFVLVSLFGPNETSTNSLIAPNQLSPADGVTMSHFPRELTLQWQPVSGATKYMLEVQIQDPYDQGWSSHPFGLDGINVENTSHTFEFIGAQPGRWRVTALGEGTNSPPSPWRTFIFTR